MSLFSIMKKVKIFFFQFHNDNLKKINNVHFQCDHICLAKAIIGKYLVGESFNAKLWLEPLTEFVGGKCQPPKSQVSFKISVL